MWAVGDRRELEREACLLVCGHKFRAPKPHIPRHGPGSSTVCDPGTQSFLLPRPHGDCEHTCEDYRWDGGGRHARRNLCVCTEGILASTEAGVHLHQPVSPAHWYRHHSLRGMNLGQHRGLVWDPSKSAAGMVLQPGMCESI